MKKKRLVATVYIDVPHGTPYTASDLAREIKNQVGDVIQEDAAVRCEMSGRAKLASRVGKLHVRAGFSLPRTDV